MLNPGASPTLMNAVAKNAFDMNSDTIQQVGRDDADNAGGARG